jgi:hypothetical protein
MDVEYDDDNTMTDSGATTSKRKRTKTQKSSARQRTDTYWVMGDEKSAEYFNKIYTGESTAHKLNQQALTKLDGFGNPQSCWRVVSFKTGHPADSLLSTTAYRISYVWSLLIKPDVWGDSDVEQLRAGLDRIKTKTRDHTCHRCGIDWCCNPLHLRVDSRVENEADKHYHYFLNHADPQVRDLFRNTFSTLMQQRGVW